MRDHLVLGELNRSPNSGWPPFLLILSHEGAGGLPDIVTVGTEDPGLPGTAGLCVQHVYLQSWRWRRLLLSLRKPLLQSQQTDPESRLHVGAKSSLRS
jgi:hypothetical protein